MNSNSAAVTIHALRFCDCIWLCFIYLKIVIAEIRLAGVILCREILDNIWIKLTSYMLINHTSITFNCIYTWHLIISMFHSIITTLHLIVPTEHLIVSNCHSTGSTWHSIILSFDHIHSFHWIVCHGIGSGQPKHVKPTVIL